MSDQNMRDEDITSTSVEDLQVELELDTADVSFSYGEPRPT